MNSMEDYRIRKSDGKICAAWMIPAVFAAGTLFGMLAMGLLAANFTEAYNPARRKKHRKDGQRRDTASQGRYAAGE